MERLGDRPYEVVDVTGFRYEFVGRDGAVVISQPAQSVGTIRSEGLRELFGSARAFTEGERTRIVDIWRRLRAENASFRVVTPDGLSSAPIDCFDPLLLAQATTEPQRVVRLVGKTMALNSEPYEQLGDHALLMPVEALVEAGSLLADGDPANLFVTRVWLP